MLPVEEQEIVQLYAHPLDVVIARPTPINDVLPIPAGGRNGYSESGIRVSENTPYRKLGE
jgi:hypothetical protein